MSMHGYCFSINLITALLLINLATQSAMGQKISNISVISPGSTENMNYEESENFNYLGLQYGNSSLYINDELITEGVHPFIDKRWNYYYVIQMDKKNQFEGFTNVYLRGYDKSLNSNSAGFDQGLKMTIADNLIYIYGSTKFTDSLFVKNDFIRNIPGSGAFVLTFNEDMELVDEFFYGLDSLAEHSDIHMEVDKNGDYHIAGRFFNSASSDFNLEIGDELIEPIFQDFATWTFYYVIVDQETKQTKVTHSFGGIYNSFARLNDFKINDNNDAFVTFDQSDSMSLNGVLLENVPNFYDITLLCLNADSLKYYVNYEGPAAQTGHLIKTLDNNHSYEYIRTRGGIYPFFINSDSTYFDSLQNHLIIDRDFNGNINWIQNIHGAIGGSDIFDITLSEDQSTIWLSGTLKTDHYFIIDDQQLVVNDRFGGFLIALNAMTGDFKQVFYPTMDSDDGISPYTYMSQIHGIEDASLKVITQLGFGNNSFQETYDYTIGDVTIPVSGKGELVIYDLDPAFMVSTEDLTDHKNSIFPNPIRPREKIHFTNDLNASYSIFTMNGKKVGEIKNNEQFPSVPEGLYWLKGNEDGLNFRVIVLTE